MNQFSPNEELHPHSISASDIGSRLSTDLKSGLSDEEVARRREKWGWNELAEADPEPVWRRFIAQFKALVIWILIAAAILAGVMGEWIDTIAILAIVVANGVLGFVQEERAGRALKALRAMSSPAAKAIRQGQLSKVPAKELVPGDLVLLEAGDQVPADIRLLESFRVTVQEASLTGESAPQLKDADAELEQKTPLGDRENCVYMGTVLASGKATGVITATGMATELGNIAGMLKKDEDETTPLQRRLNELGRILVFVCLILVGLIFLIQYSRGGELVETILVAVSLAVAAVPEGLPAVVTIALALGLQRMVKRNALIRKLPSVETLGSVTVICSDKTGTLTRNEMMVRELVVGDQHYEITGAGYEPIGQFHPISDSDSADSKESAAVLPSEHPELRKALLIGLQCNNANVVRPEDREGWAVVGDPTEGALIVMAMKGKIEADEKDGRVVFEIPFDSDRKAMSVIVELPGSKKVMYTKGAPEVILAKCDREIIDGEVRTLDTQRRLEIQAQNSKLAGKALRVLGLAYREDPIKKNERYQETDLIFAGFVGMIDPPRDEVRESIDECHDAGIRPVMITGDHPDTAIAIARELKIASPETRAITGNELDAIDDRELAERVDQISVYARVTAAHKNRVVKAWKERGEVVAMTGDGVNDAPAVQGADIGIAMGITGTDVTKEAADMVLTDDNFTSIVNAVREGRGIFDNIQKFIQYLLSCNAGEVMLMFAAGILGYPVPLLAVQILWINLVTDGFPALALAMEPPERDIMQRPPRPPRESVLTFKKGMEIIYHGALIAAAALFGFWWAFQGDDANTDAARTTAFAITAFSQLAFALVSRSHRYTLPQLGLFSNGWLFVAFAFSGILQLAVITLPFAVDIFEVAPFSTLPWAMIAVLSLLPATVIELTKIGISLTRDRR